MSTSLAVHAVALVVLDYYNRTLLDCGGGRLYVHGLHHGLVVDWLTVSGLTVHGLLRIEGYLRLFVHLGCVAVHIDGGNF